MWGEWGYIGSWVMGEMGLYRELDCGGRWDYIGSWGVGGNGVI